MPDPNASVVAQWISDEGSNSEFIAIRSIINDILSTHLTSNSLEENSELAEALEPEVIKELAALAEQSAQDGIVPRYELSLDGQTTHIKYIERPELGKLKELQAKSPDEFEHFCKHILEALGATAAVEGGKGDGGVDFTAYNMAIGGPTSPAPLGSRVVVIGQAKRYTTGKYITECNLREFVGAAIRKSYLLKRTAPDKVGLIQPIAYAFWTTSDFHPDGKIFAREMGIWYLNGLALAQLAMRLDI